MKYIRQLDGLRFLAIFFVLIQHFATIIGQHMSAGYYGVELFFVISGFLITPILLKSDEPFISAYKKFIGRRTLRIFPIYYLTIVILLVLNYVYIKAYLIYFLTYTYNYAWDHFDIPINAVTHFWSLCVEEQFYLIWPFLVLGLRNNIKVLKWVILAVIIFSTLQECATVITSIPFFIYPHGIAQQANSLALGALGAILFNENKIPIRLLDSKWIEYSVFLLLMIFLLTDYRLKFIVCPLCSLFFILKTAHNGFLFKPLNNLLNNKLIIYIGSISYGIYVFHLPMEHYFTTYVFDPLIWHKINFNALGRFKIIRRNSWIVKFPLYSFISILLAHLSYKYFERPILSFKDRYFRYDVTEIEKK
ncbi:MAG TPA: acyltransferase [Ferruginibacter sp.]|jgi:peptidoglycan/LPS O-acetylase OafA/YrhL|nr:acyltransferase [Ferruginibacter sp.]